MATSASEADQEFLLRAASVFDPDQDLSHQRQLFLETWSLLTQQARQQAVLLWRSDQNLDDAALEAAASDPAFLLRAASIYDPNSAAANQSAMFTQVWAQISPEDQQRLVNLWRQPEPVSVPAGASPPGREVPEEGLALIRTFEGYAKARPDGSAEAYADPIAGWQLPTIGYGTTRYPDGQRVRQGDVITRAQAEAYLKDDVERQCRPSLERIPTWGQMNNHQRSAPYSFAYNPGPGF